MADKADDKLAQITIIADVSRPETADPHYKRVTLRYLVRRGRYDQIWAWFIKEIFGVVGLEEGGLIGEPHVESMVDVLERLGMKTVKKDVGRRT